MRERDPVLQGLQARLATWKEMIDDYVAALARGTSALRERHAQSVQELLDRHESARIKIEKAERARDERFGEACRECERVFGELQKAWDAAIHRVSSARE